MRGRRHIVSTDKTPRPHIVGLGAKRAVTAAIMCGTVLAVAPGPTIETARAAENNGRRVAEIAVPPVNGEETDAAAQFARKRGFGIVLRSEFLGSEVLPFAIRSHDLPTHWRADGAGAARGLARTDLPLVFEFHNPYAQPIYQPYNVLEMVAVWFPLCHLDRAGDVVNVDLLTPRDGTTNFVGLFKTSKLRSMTGSSSVWLGPRGRTYECVAIKRGNDMARKYIKRNFKGVCDVGIGRTILPFCKLTTGPQPTSKSLRARERKSLKPTYVFLKGRRNIQKAVYLSSEYYRMFDIEFARLLTEFYGRDWFTPLEVRNGADGHVPRDLIDPLFAVLGGDLLRVINGLKRIMTEDKLRRMKIKVPECTKTGITGTSIRFADLIDSVELVEARHPECYRIKRTPS